eukprot:scaffold66436_cov45-Phaeocystis_antarctica.AAC.2
MQVGDVHARLPDELELVVAELDKLARGLRHGGQGLEEGLARDRVRGLVALEVLDAVDHLALDVRLHALDRRRVRGAPDAREGVEELDDVARLGLKVVILGQLARQVPAVGRGRCSLQGQPPLPPLPPAAGEGEHLAVLPVASDRKGQREGGDRGRPCR